MLSKVFRRKRWKNSREALSFCGKPVIIKNLRDACPITSYSDKRLDENRKVLEWFCNLDNKSLTNINKNLSFHTRQWTTFVRYWLGWMRCVVFTFFQHHYPLFPTESTVMLFRMFSINKEGFTMGLTQIMLIFSLTTFVWN